MSEEHVEYIKFHRIRPRIRLETHHSPNQLCDIFSRKLNEDDSKIEGTVLPNYIYIEPIKKDQHYWSPQLTITIEEKEDGSVIRGLYGPQPSVWTLFVFFYSIIGFATLIVLMIGLSYLSLGKDTSIFWFALLLILLFLTLYLVAYFGQKFGQKQMIYLHHFIEECLGRRIDPL